MTTAATLLTETPTPTAKTAVAGNGGSGQSLFATTFASLLGQGSFVQAPGIVPLESAGMVPLESASMVPLESAGMVPLESASMVPLESAGMVPLESASMVPLESASMVPLESASMVPLESASMVPLESAGTPGLATLFSTGEVGAALAGEETPADPAFNVIPLFDTTALGTPVSKNQLAGLGLGPTTPATVDLRQSIPLDGKPGHAEPVQANLDNQGHPESPRPALRGVTAADVMAEIAQLDPEGTELVAADRYLAPTPAAQASAPKAAGQTAPQTTPQVAPQAIAREIETVSMPLPRQLAAAAQAAAISSTPDGQAGREGEAPDPRAISQIAQSVMARPPSQVRAAVHKVPAKPAMGLSSPLNGDVALAAMANEMPKPGAARPAAGLTPAAGNSASGANDTPSSASSPPTPQSSSMAQPLNVAGQGNPTPPSPGQGYGPGSPGAEVRSSPVAKIAEQQTAPRVAMDVRIEALQSSAQPLRAGETAAQPERPVAMPPPPAPPAEQVAMQLRHGLAKGADKINIQLSPASLGSVDVTLEISSGSRVVVHITAERADTLDMLRADFRGLERALQEAGLRTEQGSLNFNLRGDGNGASHEDAASAKDFDGNGQAGDDETGAESEDILQDSPARQASNQSLDIEV